MCIFEKTENSPRIAWVNVMKIVVENHHEAASSSTEIEEKRWNDLKIIQLINLSFSQVSSDDFPLNEQTKETCGFSLYLFSYQNGRKISNVAEAAAKTDRAEIHRLLITFKENFHLFVFFWGKVFPLATIVCEKPLVFWIA